ncbi:hypothetical protein D9M68_827290 [compost metagenome]
MHAHQPAAVQAQVEQGVAAHVGDLFQAAFAGVAALAERLRGYRDALGTQGQAHGHADVAVEAARQFQRRGHVQAVHLQAVVVQQAALEHVGGADEAGAEAGVGVLVDLFRRA